MANPKGAITIVSSADKLSNIDWKNIKNSPFYDIKSVNNKGNDIVFPVKEEKDVSLFKIKFDKMSLLKVRENNGYKVVLKVESKVEQLCKKNNSLLEQIWGKPVVINDRNGFLQDYTSQWVFGDTYISSWCFGMSTKQTKDMRNNFIVTIAK